ncbi:MAG: orotate phosphoribosyltransferase, partial [Anaeroplasmataceae bacterium]
KDVNIIMGTATAGIPHATLVADLLDLPTGYVRGKAKEHGRTNQIEGKYTKGDKVLVVEDLISTGGSSIECVKVLEDAGLVVLGVISIFTYGMTKASDNFKNANVKNDSLVKIEELLEVAKEKELINEKEEKQVLMFVLNPQKTDWINN